jgi:hypothetical protein
MLWTFHIREWINKLQFLCQQTWPCPTKAFSPISVNIMFSVLSTFYRSQVYSGWPKQTRRHMACLISRILLVEVNLHISTDMALSSFMQHTGVLGFHFGVLSFQYVIFPYPKGLQRYFQQPFSFMCHFSSILLVYTWQNTGIRFPTITTQAKWHSVHVWLQDRAPIVVYDICSWPRLQTAKSLT